MVIEHNLDVIKTADWIVDLDRKAAVVAAKSSSPVRQKPCGVRSITHGTLPQADAVIVKPLSERPSSFRVAPAIYVFLPQQVHRLLIRRIHQIIDLRIRSDPSRYTVLQCALFRWRLGAHRCAAAVAAQPAPGWFSANSWAIFYFFHHRKQHIFHFDRVAFQSLCTLCSAPGFAMQYVATPKWSFFTPLVVSR